MLWAMPRMIPAKIEKGDSVLYDNRWWIVTKKEGQRITGQLRDSNVSTFRTFTTRRVDRVEKA
jgi:hypothetical protein